MSAVQLFTYLYWTAEAYAQMSQLPVHCVQLFPCTLQLGSMLNWTYQLFSCLLILDSWGACSGEPVSCLAVHIHWTAGANAGSQLMRYSSVKEAHGLALNDSTTVCPASQRSSSSYEPSAHLSICSAAHLSICSAVHLPCSILPSDHLPSCSIYILRMPKSAVCQLLTSKVKCVNNL